MAKSSRPDTGTTKAQQTLTELTLGKREPADSREKRLLKQINEIKDKGRIVDIPPEF
jgi:uncharacterized protein YifE (UPF0438 family)